MAESEKSVTPVGVFPTPTFEDFQELQEAQKSGDRNAILRFMAKFDWVIVRNTKTGEITLGPSA